MKYIFFDIDGVLNTKSSWIKPFSLNDNCIKVLADIVNETNALLIMTSTWKTGFIPNHKEEWTPQIIDLENRLNSYSCSLHDKTPELKGRTRDKEVERYLYFNPCDTYVIIDDDTSLYSNTNHLVEINCSTGLTESDKVKIKRFL